jgi:hypothetical protein
MTRCVRNVQGLRVVAGSKKSDGLQVEEIKMQIVKKSVASVGFVREAAIREATTGRVIPFASRGGVVPKVWAVADVDLIEAPEKVLAPEVAFYRKYTEALVRKYLKMSMECGRVPSLLGREMFRGSVTHYNRVGSFEDVVIFCHDVEKCLGMLDLREKALVKRVTMQEYSFGEAAGYLGVSHRTCTRMYMRTIDKLTGVLMEHGLLKPQEWGGRESR